MYSSSTGNQEHVILPLRRLWDIRHILRNQIPLRSGHASSSNLKLYAKVLMEARSSDFTGKPVGPTNPPSERQFGEISFES